MCVFDAMVGVPWLVGSSTASPGFAEDFAK
jgi:hypothetical protein